MARTLGDLAGSIYSQNRLDDAAQPYHQVLNTLDSRAFHLGGVQKLHRLFDELELRERAMIVLRCSVWDAKKGTDGAAIVRSRLL